MKKIKKLFQDPMVFVALFSFAWLLVVFGIAYLLVIGGVKIQQNDIRQCIVVSDSNEKAVDAADHDAIQILARNLRAQYVKPERFGSQKLYLILTDKEEFLVAVEQGEDLVFVYNLNLRSMLNLRKTFEKASEEKPSKAPK